MQRYVFAATVTFPVDFSGSQASAGTAASAATTFQIEKNGTAIGTMGFAAAATTAGFAMAAATVFNAGDVLTIVAPATPDATLADLAWTLRGTE